MAFRSPFDFSAGGALVQNATQLALAREVLSSERRAMRQQSATERLLVNDQAHRYKLAMDALRQREEQADFEHAQKERARSRRHQIASQRDQEVRASAPHPALLPFSAHCQRMPPPLPRVPPASGANTARFHRNQGITPATANGSFSARTHKHAALAVDDATTPLVSLQPNTSHLPLAFDHAAFVVQPPSPAGSALSHATAAERDLSLPASRAASTPGGLESRTHPFYKHTMHQVNSSDREYLSLLSKRYPSTALAPAHPHPQRFALPAGYSVNSWSTDWSSQRVKCRETRTQELLVAKRYI